MNYLTSYCRREGGGSLLLQEYRCGDIPACFALLCSREGEKGGEMTERLLSWNRRFPWHRAAKAPGRWLDRAQRELGELASAWEEPSAERELSEMRAAWEGPSAWRESRLWWRLLVCVDQELLTLGNGCELCLLSGSLGQGSARRLSGSFRGCLEPGAGILLAEEGFLDHLPPQALAQAARTWEIRTQQQADRRLRELAGRGRAPEERRSVILLLTEDFSL